MATQKQSLSTAEAAALINPEMRPKTLQKWRDSGRGPAYVAVSGRFSHYRRQDVEAWIARNVAVVDPENGTTQSLPANDAAHAVAAGIDVDNDAAQRAQDALEHYVNTTYAQEVSA